MTAKASVRRLDDRPVQAIRYTGGNLDRLQTWVEAGLRLADTGEGRVAPAPEHRPARVEVRAWNRVLNDGERVYAVGPHAFWSHHDRTAPIE